MNGGADPESPRGPGQNFDHRPSTTGLKRCSESMSSASDAASPNFRINAASSELAASDAALIGEKRDSHPNVPTPVNDKKGRTSQGGERLTEEALRPLGTTVRNRGSRGSAGSVVSGIMKAWKYLRDDSVHGHTRKKAQSVTVLTKSQQTVDRLQAALASAVLHPDDVRVWYWDTLLLVAIAYYGLFVPVQYVVHREDLVATHLGHVVIEVFFTLVLVVDIIVRSNTAYFCQATQVLVEDIHAIRYAYLRGALARDVAAALPLDLVFLLAFGSQFLNGWLHIGLSHLRLLKLLSLPNLFVVATPVKLRRSTVRYQFAIVPMLRLVTYCMLAVNAITVMWILLNGTDHRDQDGMYIEGLYWVLYTVTTIGYGDIPVDTSGKRMFACVLFIVGVVVHSIVISRISSRMQKGDVQSERNDRMKETLSILTKFAIPDELASEVLAFQYHQLHSSVGGSFKRVMQHLPDSMQQRVGLFVRVKFICQVPMFRDLPMDCLVDLANALKTHVLEPEQRIIKAGEEGREMFFMSHGFADVISPQGDHWGTIRPGGFFGEIALLTNSRRTASITTLTYCDLFRLDKKDFMAFIGKYAELRSAVQEEMIRRKIHNAEDAHLIVTLTMELEGEYDALGVVWDPRPEGFAISQMSPGLAADRAGAHVGMILCTVDGHAVQTNAELEAVEDLLHTKRSAQFRMILPDPSSPLAGGGEDSPRRLQNSDTFEDFNNTDNTPFALDLMSTGRKDTPPSGRLNRIGSDVSYGSDMDRSQARTTPAGGEEPVTTPRMRRSGVRHKGDRGGLPDITLNPPPTPRLRNFDVVARLNRFEDRLDGVMQSVQKMETMMSTLCDALGLQVSSSNTKLSVDDTRRHLYSPARSMSSGSFDVTQAREAFPPLPPTPNMPRSPASSKLPQQTERRLSRVLSVDSTTKSIMSLAEAVDPGGFSYQGNESECSDSPHDTAHGSDQRRRSLASLTMTLGNAESDLLPPSTSSVHNHRGESPVSMKSPPPINFATSGHAGRSPLLPPRSPRNNGGSSVASSNIEPLPNPPVPHQSWSSPNSPNPPTLVALNERPAEDCPRQAGK